MDISVLKAPIDFTSPNNVTSKVIPRTQPVEDVKTENKDYFTVKELTVTTDEKVNKEPVDIKHLTQMTEAMNKFVQAIDANIRFKVHEKSNQLMVQVVDQVKNIVLKEFPSSEFLDTIAAIRDYVGILLDKKI